MSAQLPYLPPLKPKSVFRKVVEGVSEDVQAAPSAIDKAALALRGSAAMIPAVSRTAADTLQEASQAYTNAQQAVRGGTEQFLSTLFGGTPAKAAPTPAVVAAPGLPIPAVTTPESPALAPLPAIAAVKRPSSAYVPATQAPLSVVSPAALAAQPAPRDLPAYGEAITTGIAQQRDYAAEQRKPFLEALQYYVDFGGHADNRSARAKQAIGALSSLPQFSGTNNFASLQERGATGAAATAAQLQASQATTAERAAAAQAQVAAERERTAVLDASNQRTVAAQRFETTTRANEVRRNAQPTVIGQTIQNDPITKMPLLVNTYGFVEKDETGKVVVKDMQGTIQKPAAPPVTRAEFVKRNKIANPTMTPAQLEAEYDRKYPGSKN